MRRPAVVAVMAVIAASVSTAAWERVISYGADLSPEDRISVLRDFALPPEVNPSQIPGVTVEHREEVALLQGVAPPEVIGTRAISSVYIENEEPGSGLLVSAKNITWVTPAMYANAMATGGVRDARVIVTAPSPVSGTAALTGIFKAFSYMTGRALSPAARETAAEELVRTGELGEKIGQEPATAYMARTKEEVVRSGAKSAAEIRAVVERVAREENLSLSEEQVRGVVDVMIRLSKLEISLDQLRAQLKNFAVETPRPATGIGGFIAQIIEFLQSLFKQLVGFVARMLR